MPRVTITIPDKTPQPYRFPLDRRLVSLGRGSENDIPIDCGSVSVKHAEMRRVDGGYELRDLGSTNGIKSDGERSDVIPLKNGMSVTLGDVAFDFLLSDEELNELADERARMDHPVLPPVPEPGDDNQVPEPVKHASDADACREKAGDACGDAPCVCCSPNRCWMILLFVILAAAAFIAGMAVRHQKDTGKSMLKEAGSKSEAPAKPEAASKSDEDPAATEDTPAGEDAASDTPAKEDGPEGQTTEEDDLFGPEVESK